MGKSKKKATSSTSVTLMPSGIVDIGSVNLRTAGPVTRLRGIVEKAVEKLTAAQVKVSGWDCKTETLQDLLAEVLARIPDIQQELEDLEKSGYSPPRKSYTAQTAEGDHVSILEKYRANYKDILDEELMDNLLVVRKNENRGGLILEAANKGRLKTATAHVVRLSVPR